MSQHVHISLNSRGILACDPAQLKDVRRNFQNALGELGDIGKSLIILVSIQTWTTAYGLLVMLLSCLFFKYYRPGGISQDGSAWMPVGFLVFLPLLGVLWQTYSRREQALRDLTKGS